MRMTGKEISPHISSGKIRGVMTPEPFDMDKDGDLDVLIAGHGSKNVVWYENPLK
jgi:hypothetical protein